MDNLPLVSIVVLCRNEEEFIGRCLDSLLANDYPKDRLEVFVADGMSQDGTRGIVESYSEKHPFVKLLDNPKRIPATAANQGIKAAKGDLVMIAGAHALYPTDYVSKCAAYSQKYPAADNVGGVRLTEARDNTTLGRSIAYVSSHRFGAGTATYHRGGTSPSWVDSVWGGCYRKEVFERLGLYNESLTVGEDREFNLRLRGFGGKILQVPEITCTYYARSKFRDFCRWAFRMGFWPFYADKLLARRLLAPRNLAPLAFIVSLFLSLGISAYFTAGRYLLGGILSAYLAGAVASSLPLLLRERKLRYLAATPFIFAVTHAFYAVGSIYGILKPVPALRIETQ
ncbi:MAG: glycosyltransferase family 2 protein [Acidobacteriia bacterium]|nr:glycosyltransferase family 2 protein [Terriglobia bacterium]